MALHSLYRFYFLIKNLNFTRTHVHCQPMTGPGPIIVLDFSGQVKQFRAGPLNLTPMLLIVIIFNNVALCFLLPTLNP